MGIELKELFLEELKREEAGTRKALERVPEGLGNWAPHEESMRFGYLASLVATMPGWIDLIVNSDESDFAPAGENNFKPKQWTKRAELLDIFDGNLRRARTALESTTDDRLLAKWKLKANGQLISDEPRYLNIQNNVLNHWAHHRGQLTVYLRMNGAAVPALYGPSADERLGLDNPS